MISSLSASLPSFRKATNTPALFLECLAHLLGTRFRLAEGVAILDVEARLGRQSNLRIRMCQELGAQRAYHEDKHMSVFR